MLTPADKRFVPWLPEWHDDLLDYPPPLRIMVARRVRDQICAMHAMVAP